MRRRITILLSLVALSLLVFEPHIAYSQEKEANIVKEAALDLSVPESPAFTVLGITPQEVIRPTSPKQLSVQLLQGVDPKGNLQTGFALDTAPYLLFFGDEVSLERYQEHYIVRALARMQFSLATAKGTSDDDKAIRLGLGFRLTPWDLGDPRNDEVLLKCFRKELRPDEAKKLDDEIVDLKVSEAPQEEIAKKIEELNALTNKPATACREDTRKRHWNASSWSLGVAPSFISPTGATEDLEFNTASFWSSFAYGFESVPGLRDSSQFLVGVRYSFEEMVLDTSNGAIDAFREQDTLSIAGQLRIGVYPFQKGSAPSFVLSIEGDYFRADPKGGRDVENTYRISLAGDAKLAGTNNTYVKISVGTSGGGSDENDQGFIQITMRRGLLGL